MSNNTNRSLPELLAPIGGWKQLEAAVNHGADAVYMGGSLFNARINAENFTEETLRDAVDYAHERGVRVYITFNTLIKDSELEKAFRYACFLYEIGADALILQDMGLARLIHRYLPDFPIHLSTQGTVYNVHALDLVRQMGFKRVVPARELSLEEIRRFCAAAHEAAAGAAASDAAAPGSEAPLEVEVFVHGALCMCYSGQCQLSRAFGGGGRSGNRGLCAQPCRLLYTDDKGRKGYFLSPKDLCALELLPQLIEAGVDSFKIEGRLKSPEYVAVTTGVYRKYIDLYAEITGAADSGSAGGMTVRNITPEEWKALIDPGDMQKLKQIFNRGGFTTGYLEGNPGRKILSGASPKNQGIYLGTVTAVSPVKGKGSSGSKGGGRDKVLADVQLQGSGTIGRGGGAIALGDGVEIRRRMEDSTAALTTGSNVVTFVETLQNNTVRIGDFDRGIGIGDRVYKVTDKALREEALSAQEKKQPVSMRFRAHLGQATELAVTLNDTGAGAALEELAVRVCGDFAVERALKKPTDEEKIRNQLRKLGDTCFSASPEDISIDIDPDIMIPVSVINQMRREAAEALREMIRGAVRAKRRPLTEERIETIIAEEQLGNSEAIRRVESLRKTEEKGRDAAGQSDEPPYILHVSKGELDEYIEENFEALAEQYRDTGVLIGNLGWIRQFMDAGVQVYGDYGLNVYNSQSVKAFEEMGVKVLHTSYECCESGRTEGQRFGGRVPLMITEHPFGTDHLVDRKGVKHEIVRFRDKSILF